MISRVSGQKGKPPSPEEDLVPAVVFLRASFLWIRLICAIIAEQVRRDIMDLHTRSMIQHLQILKYRLPDLIQVLCKKKRNDHSEIWQCAPTTATCLHHLCGGHENQKSERNRLSEQMEEGVNSVTETQAHRKQTTQQGFQML